MSSVLSGIVDQRGIIDLGGIDDSRRLIFFSQLILGERYFTVAPGPDAQRGIALSHAKVVNAEGAGNR